MAFAENKIKKEKQSMLMLYIGPIVGSSIFFANKLWETILSL